MCALYLGVCVCVFACVFVCFICAQGYVGLCVIVPIALSASAFMFVGRLVCKFVCYCVCVCVYSFSLLCCHVFVDVSVSAGVASVPLCACACLRVCVLA